MDQEEIKKENEFLALVYQHIDEQLAQSVQETKIEEENLLTIRQSLWSDLGMSRASANQMMDVGQQIATLRNVGVDFSTRLYAMKQLQALERSPYFGRMDFLEQGFSEKEALYIGLGSLMDKETRLPLIYDWRAPISTMFYDFGLGEASYLGPEGDKYQGVISLKRQYRIQQRVILTMFENELKIDDEVLQEALGKHATEKMRHIVNSIQKDQNRAIRDERAPVILVEGPAGSGKTSVALHRIAYLLYRYRDTLSSGNIVIFSPNKIFSAYISHVLPALGEENVHQTTFKEYADEFLRWKYDIEGLAGYVESTLKQEKGLEDSARRLAFKGSTRYQEILDKLLDKIYLHVEALPSISLEDKVVVTQKEMQTLLRDDYAYLPLARRLTKLYSRLCLKLRPIKKKAIRERYQELRKEQTELELSNFECAREAIQEIRDKVLKLKETYHPFFVVDGAMWYCKLLEEPDFFLELAGDTPRLKGFGESAKPLRKGFVRYEDLAAILYLQGKLEGFPERKGIRHVVLDEVQDYSPLDLKVLALLFPRAKVTMVGDMQQSILPSEDYLKCESLEERICWKGLHAVKLTKSYRSTDEVFQFAGAIANREDRKENLFRSGSLPLVTKGKEEDRIPWCLRQINEAKLKGYESIALICLSIQESRALYQRLRPYTQVLLLDTEQSAYQSGVVILPVHLAKGLEFDGVLIPDGSAKRYHTPFHKRMLYVAVTRALHSLALFYTHTPAHFLPSQKERLALYEEFLG